MYRFICRAQIQRQHYMNEVDSESFQYAHLQARTGGRPSQELMLTNMVPVLFRRPAPPWQVWMRCRGPFKAMAMLLHLATSFSCDAVGLWARAMALDCALGKLPHQVWESS